MKKVIFAVLLILMPLVCSAANPPARQSYMNRHGSVVARSYTNGQYTVYKDNRGNTLGYSKDAYNGTKILDKSGTYKGYIANGLARDSRGNIVGSVKKGK